MTRIIKLTEEAENWLRHKPDSLKSRQVAAKIVDLLEKDKPKSDSEGGAR